MGWFCTVILAIDTSTSRTSAALVDGARVVAEKYADGAMSHGEVLGVLFESLFATTFTTPSAVTAVAVGTGPGPFTGLRVGIAFARTFAWARSIPVLGVCSLDAIAADCTEPEFTVVTDARRKEVYWANYRDGVRQTEPAVNKPGDIAQSTYAIGDGAFIYSDFFPEHHEPKFPRASQIAFLAVAARDRGEELSIEARYLRHPDVTL